MLHWTLSSTSMPLLCWWSHNWTQDPKWSTSADWRGGIPLPWPSANNFPKAVQDIIGILLAKSPNSLMKYLVCTRTTRSSLQICFATGWSSAHAGTWGCYYPGAGLCNSPSWAHEVPVIPLLQSVKDLLGLNFTLLCIRDSITEWLGLESPLNIT